MAYPKTNWTDGENKYSLTDQLGNVIPGFENIKLLYTGTGGTPLSATNMNKIEQGIYDLDGNKISSTQKGVANGVCELDSGILIPAARLPVIPTAKLSNVVDALDNSAVLWELLGSTTLSNSTTTDVTFSSLPSGYSAFRIIGKLACSQAPSNDSAWDMYMKANGLTSGYATVTKHAIAATTFESTGTKWSFGRFLPGHSGAQEKSFVDIVVDALPSSTGYYTVRASSRVYNAYGSGFNDAVGFLSVSVASQPRITSLVLSMQYWDINSSFKLYGAKTYA